MIEPTSILTGISLGKSIWGFLQEIISYSNEDVLVAHFDANGQRLSGSEKIEIEINFEKDSKNRFWYKVKNIEDYVFVREAINSSCTHELIGTVSGETMPDARYWRWVAPVSPGTVHGGANYPNMKVDFIVVGYRPKSLIKKFKK